MVSFSLPALGRAVALLSLTSVLPAMAAPAPAPAPAAEIETSLLEARAGVPWVARHGLSAAQYQQAFDSWVSQGYRVTYVAGYSANNDARYAALWEKSTPYAWVARHGLKAAEYQQAFDGFTAQGYRPRHVYGYEVAGTVRYAAIWDKSPAPGNGAWVARHGLTPAQYQQAFDSFGAQGYRLAHISGYSDAGQARYAAIWERPANSYAWVARHGLTSAQYQQAFNTYTSQGYRPVKVSGYAVGGVDYYAAIWDKAPSPAWVARHAMTSAQYQSEFNSWTAQGYRPTVISAYTLSGTQDRYAAVWVKDV